MHFCCAVIELLRWKMLILLLFSQAVEVQNTRVVDKPIA
jgi:hypothetical protein